MSCEHLVMSYSTFPKTKNDALKEPMFFGQPVNVARYDRSAPGLPTKFPPPTTQKTYLSY